MARLASATMRASSAAPGRARRPRSSVRARSTPRAPPAACALPCPIRSRAGPSRRCAACDGPSPTRPPPNCPRAAAVRPGTADPRTRHRPSPRGSGARRGSPSCARSAAGPRHRDAADSWPDRSATATGELTRSAATVETEWTRHRRSTRLHATDLVGFLACDHLDPRTRACRRPLGASPSAGRPGRSRSSRRRASCTRPLPRDLRAEGRPGSSRSRPGRSADRSIDLRRGRRPDHRRDARRRRRHLPGDVLRWALRGHADFLFRVRRSPDARALGPLELRDRGHQAGAPRQGRRDPPDLRLREPARGPPGDRPGVAPLSSPATASSIAHRTDDFMAYFR